MFMRLPLENFQYATTHAYDGVSSGGDSMARARPVVIDTDPGVDDALALILAWASPEIQVGAVTTVAGNVPVETASLNARRLVSLCRPIPVPIIAAGAGAPLAQPLVTATHYHGDDGLGDVAEWPLAMVELASVSAIDVLVDAARREASPLTLIALGPRTHVAR